MHKISSLALTAVAAIGLMSCESKMEYSDALEYTYGIWPGSTVISSGGNFEYFDSVFTSWEYFGTQSVYASGNTLDEWYADGDLHIQRYVTDLQDLAQIRYNELVQAATTKDWGEGEYSRKGIYFFFTRNMRASQDEYIRKQEFQDFKYSGGSRAETAPVTVTAAEFDSVTVECANDFSAGVKASRNHFLVCTADRTIYTGIPFISTVNVAYNDATSKNEITIYFSATAQTVSKLIELYGSDWYLVTFMDVTDGQTSMKNYFAAQTPFTLTVNP